MPETSEVTNEVTNEAHLLARQIERVRALLDSTPDAILSVSRDELFCILNRLRASLAPSRESGALLDTFREYLDDYRRAIHATEWATTEERPEYERAEWAKRWELFSAIAAALASLERDAARMREALTEAERERDMWRWLHWGHHEASWACVCGHGHGWATNYCDECGTWRPMKPDILAEVQLGAPYDAALVAKYRPALSPSGEPTITPETCE